MPRQYVATLKQGVLVECECEQCRERFEYVTYLEAKGSHYFKEKAEDAARKALNKKLKTLTTYSPDNTACLRLIEPLKCPNCRHTQSWMNIYYRRRYTVWLLWAAAIIMFLAVVLVDPVRSSATSMLLTAVVIAGISLVGVALVQVITSVPDSNRNRLPRLSLPSRPQYE